MPLSFFADKSKKPKTAELEKALGRTSTHWNGLIDYVASEYPPVTEEWNFGGANWGWSLRLKHKKRAVLYMTPCKGHFTAGFVLGEKAVKAARDSRLPGSILEVIDKAKKYAEGRAVRLEVRNKKDLDSVKKLTTIKVEH